MKDTSNGPARLPTVTVVCFLVTPFTPYTLHLRIGFRRERMKGESDRNPGKEGWDGVTRAGMVGWSLCLLVCRSPLGVSLPPHPFRLVRPRGSPTTGGVTEEGEAERNGGKGMVTAERR